MLHVYIDFNCAQCAAAAEGIHIDPDAKAADVVR